MLTGTSDGLSTQRLTISPRAIASMGLACTHLWSTEQSVTPLQGQCRCGPLTERERRWCHSRPGRPQRTHTPRSRALTVSRDFVGMLRFGSATDWPFAQHDLVTTGEADDPHAAGLLLEADLLLSLIDDGR